MSSMRATYPMSIDKPSSVQPRWSYISSLTLAASRTSLFAIQTTWVVQKVSCRVEDVADWWQAPGKCICNLEYVRSLRSICILLAIPLISGPERKWRPSIWINFIETAISSLQTCTSRTWRVQTSTSPTFGYWRYNGCVSESGSADFEPADSVQRVDMLF